MFNIKQVYSKNLLTWGRNFGGIKFGSQASIKDAGGSLAQRLATNEEEYFRKKVHFFFDSF